MAQNDKADGFRKRQRDEEHHDVEVQSLDLDKNLLREFHAQYCVDMHHNKTIMKRIEAKQESLQSDIQLLINDVTLCSTALTKMENIKLSNIKKVQSAQALLGKNTVDMVEHCIKRIKSIEQAVLEVDLNLHKRSGRNTAFNSSSTELIDVTDEFSAIGGSSLQWKTKSRGAMSFADMTSEVSLKLDKEHQRTTKEE